MKRKQLLLKLLLVFVIGSCSKKDKTEGPSIRADFYFSKTCYKLLMPDNNQVIDTSINFINTSDSGSKVTYKWNFGDNTFSTEKNSTHSYKLPGTYKVSLLTLYDNVESGIAEKDVFIFIGQHNYKRWGYTYLTDADVTADNGVIALLSGYNHYNDPTSYAILLTDSLLNEKWVKQLGVNTRLSSIRKTTGNEYILSGNFEAAANDFSITKINSNGDQVWTRSSAGLPGYSVNAIETSDKGYIAIGSTSTIPEYVAVVKWDNSGNEVWRKIFKDNETENQLRDGNNIIETTDGYVFPSISSYYPSLVLTKLGFTGDIIQQGRIPLSTASGLSGAAVSKSSNGYLVNPENGRTCYFFDNSLLPTNVKEIGNSSVNSVLSWDNNYYTAEGSFQYAEVQKLSNVGATQWAYDIKHYILKTCYVTSYGATRYARKVIKGWNDFVALSDGEDQPDFNGSSVYIERITMAGTSR